MKQVEDKLFLKVIGKSRLQMPFSGLEDAVLNRIVLVETERRSIRSRVFISWFFFIVGALSGLAAAMIIPMFEVSLFGLELRYVTVIVQVVLFIAIASQFDSLLSHTRRLQIRLK